MTPSRTRLGILLTTLGFAFFLTMFLSVVAGGELLPIVWHRPLGGLFQLFERAPWFALLLVSGFGFFAAYPTFTLISYALCRTISWCSFRICAWSYTGAALTYLALWVWGPDRSRILIRALLTFPWLLLGLLAVWAGAKLATAFKKDVRSTKVPVKCGSEPGT